MRCRWQLLTATGRFGRLIGWSAECANRRSRVSHENDTANRMGFRGMPTARSPTSICTLPPRPISLVYSWTNVVKIFWSIGIDERTMSRQAILLGQPVLRYSELNENSTRYDYLVAAPSDDDLVKMWTTTGSVSVFVTIFVAVVFTSVLLSKKTRQLSFNLYLVGLMIPDLTMNFFCIIRCFMAVASRHSQPGHVSLPVMVHVLRLHGQCLDDCNYFERATRKYIGCNK